jgi:hypothetical protein
MLNMHMDNFISKVHPMSGYGDKSVRPYAVCTAKPVTPPQYHMNWSPAAPKAAENTQRLRIRQEQNNRTIIWGLSKDSMRHS